MNAPAPLVSTMKALAREQWKENAFPVIHNGRIIEWNPYYFDELPLLLATHQVKSELTPNEVQVLQRKISFYSEKKITGRKILARIFLYDDRRTRGVDEKLFFKNSAIPTEAFIFSKTFELTIARHSVFFLNALKNHLGEIRTQDMSLADRDYLLDLSRLRVMEGKIREPCTRKIHFTNGEVLEIPEYYVQALSQDSPFFDDLFSTSESPIKLLAITKEEINLLIMFAYEQNTERHYCTFNKDQVLRVAHLALKFKMEGLLKEIKSSLFTTIYSLDNFNQFDTACKLYPLFFNAIGDGELREEIEEYFSSVISKCPPAEFKTALSNLNEIGLFSFKLWPQKDGFDDKRVETIVEMLPNLSILNLIDIRNLNPKALAKVGQMKMLKELLLSSPGINDSALKEISKITTLTNLALAGDLITDEGLSHLVNLQNLVQILIWGPSKITDKGVRYFDEIKSLKSLKLPKCVSLSIEALQALSVPHVYI